MLAVFALCFNQLFSEYDMGATFHSVSTYGMIIKTMTERAENGRSLDNMNAMGRQCASTVFIMLVSGLVLYLVYGVGSRDLAERLDIRDRRRKRMDRLLGRVRRPVKQ